MTNAITKRRVLAASGQLMLHAVAAPAARPGVYVSDRESIGSSDQPWSSSFHASHRKA